MCCFFSVVSHRWPGEETTQCETELRAVEQSRNELWLGLLFLFRVAPVSTHGTTQSAGQEDMCLWPALESPRWSRSRATQACLPDPGASPGKRRSGTGAWNHEQHVCCMSLLRTSFSQWFYCVLLMRSPHWKGTWFKPSLAHGFPAEQAACVVV